MLSCPTYLAGAVATPTDGTVNLYDPNHELIADAEPVAVLNGIATYTVPGATTSALEVGRGWRVEWALEMPDGDVHDFVNEVILCRSIPHPVVTERTLYARVPSLDPAGPAAISARTEYRSFLEESWTQIRNLLLARENRAELILTPSVLREPHVLLTLALVFEDLATRLNAAHVEIAKSYRAQFDASWASLDLRDYDSDDDGEADTARPARGSTWLM